MLSVVRQHKGEVDAILEMYRLTMVMILGDLCYVMDFRVFFLCWLLVEIKFASYNYCKKRLSKEIVVYKSDLHDGDVDIMVVLFAVISRIGYEKVFEKFKL